MEFRMEGERAFIQELKTLKGKTSLLQDNQKIAYTYSLGVAYKTSDGWEPLGPAGCYDTFGPELSFGQNSGCSLGSAEASRVLERLNRWVPWARFPVPARRSHRSRSVPPGSPRSCPCPGSTGQCSSWGHARSSFRSRACHPQSHECRHH